LAGLVAITAPCAFVAPWAAVLIGAISGVLVVWSCLFVERVLKVDDPVGAISVHGTNGAWGVLSLGLFADGTYGQGWNGTHWYLVNNSLKWFDHALSTDEIAGMAKSMSVAVDKIVETGVTGLFYGNASQFFAECIGVLANCAWVFVSAYVFFWIVEKLIGNRVSAETELQGLDVPEMGVLGYINEDPKTPEGHLAHGGAEPRPAVQPPGGRKRFVVVVDGVRPDELTTVWETVCKPNGAKASADFLNVYRDMTTVSGNRFRFRGGEADQARASLDRLLKQYPQMRSANLRVEAAP
jgi:Amt family ammonium transporter